MNFNSRILVLFVALCLPASCALAQITAGRITYERKTNLYKKFSKWKDIQNWIKEEDKTKVDVFELYFNDSLSVFKPEDSDLKENMSWATNKNTVYQNLNANKRYTIKDIWGDDVHMTDTLYTRNWKITDSRRNISGYNCRKAIWQADDTTRIYAWYCDEIAVSTGPESFSGLPGAILGLATEDGGVIYFAKSIEAKAPDPNVFIIPKTKSKVHDPAQLRAELEKQYAREPWGKVMIRNLFGYW